MHHFKVWSVNRLTKKIIVADDFQSFLKNVRICIKFNKSVFEMQPMK